MAQEQRYEQIRNQVQELQIDLLFIKRLQGLKSFKTFMFKLYLVEKHFEGGEFFLFAFEELAIAEVL